MWMDGGGGVKVNLYVDNACPRWCKLPPTYVKSVHHNLSGDWNVL